MLVIGNGKLFTRDEKLPYIENGAVAADGTKIVKIAATEEIRKLYPDAEYIDAKGGVIMPMSIFTAPWQGALALRATIRRGFWIFWTASGGRLTAGLR